MIAVGTVLSDKATPDIPDGTVILEMCLACLSCLLRDSSRAQFGIALSFLTACRRDSHGHAVVDSRLRLPTAASVAPASRGNNIS